MSGELPSKYNNRHKVERLNTADSESAAELRSFVFALEGSPDSTLSVEEPIAEEQMPALRVRTRRSGDLAKRRADVFNAGLASTPEAKKEGIEKWRERFDRNWDRVKHFLRTAIRKGRFNPEILAGVLNARAAERKSVKASIIKQGR